jgi:hypothetical protein
MPRFNIETQADGRYVIVDTQDGKTVATHRFFKQVIREATEREMRARRARQAARAIAGPTLADLSARAIAGFGRCGDAFNCDADRAIARRYGLESDYLAEANRRAPAQDWE